MAKHDSDHLAIRAIIENWVIWRDARMWDRFRTLWHKEGQMWATWFQGSYEEFIKVSAEGYKKGVRINHMLRAPSPLTSRLQARHRADQKLSIAQRAEVEGVRCDVTCHGRAYDFMEKRKGKSGVSSCAVIFTRKIVSIQSIRARNSRSTRNCWRAFLKAIATSLICRPRSEATPSKTNCPDWMGRRSRRYTPKATPG